MKKKTTSTFINQLLHKKILIGYNKSFSTVPIYDHWTFYFFNIIKTSINKRSTGNKYTS